MQASYQDSDKLSMHLCIDVDVDVDVDDIDRYESRYT